MSDAVEATLINEPPLHYTTKKNNVGKLFKDLMSIVSPYWKSEERLFAWSMLVTVLILNMSSIYLAVLLNRWSGQFYNALQELNKTVFASLLLKFVILVMIAVSIFVAAKFSEQYLAFRWRMWLTKNLLKDWLEDNTFARLFTYQYKTENPDQRISQDINLFATKGLELTFVLLNSFVSSITFAVILWTLSSNLLLPLPGGGGVAIPGYMLWFTILYVSMATFVIYKFGKPLISLDYAQEKVEANFRFSLMRIRDRRDEVAILNGADAEAKFLKVNMFDIVKNFKNIIRQNIYVNSFQNVFNNLATIMPILAAAPMFFSGVITLGVLMQIGNAFGRVEDAMMQFALNFQIFASWKATFNRIVDFKEEINDLKHKMHKQGSNLSIQHQTESNFLQIQDLSIQLPASENLARFDLQVAPKDRLLIMGRSGLGKSTLLKCIAGHWPYAIGKIIRPTDLMIIPQKPYFPINTLRNSLLYPNLSVDISDIELYRVLEVCSLEILKGRLDEVNDWLAILSLGEQQRLNFARVILAKPKWLLMDEPTASMDKALEANIFEVLLKELPDLTLITIGHATSLKQFHTRCLEL